MKKVQITFSEADWQALMDARGRASLAGYCRFLILGKLRNNGDGKKARKIAESFGGGEPRRAAPTDTVHSSAEMPTPPIPKREPPPVLAPPDFDLPIEEEKPIPPEQRRQRGAVCEHGRRLNHNCWQCGGLAVIR